jgi:alpha-L-fucosidase
MDTVRAHEETTTIGYKRIVRFETVTTNCIEIMLNSQRGPVCINNIGAYYSGNDDAFSSQQATTENDESLPLLASANGNEILIDLYAQQNVSKLFYTPQPDSGIIYNYSVFTANKNAKGNGMIKRNKIASGEFSNIKNNPIEQSISFANVKTRYLILKAESMTDENGPVKFKKIRVE